MKCKLCLAEKQLCKSHIIPEFAFKPLYDSEHRFIEVTDIDRGRAKKSQIGYWERLLCDSCEQIINRYEKHALTMIREPLPSHQLGSKRIRMFPNLSYNLIKLFFLSVLWRSSVSTHQVFKLVKLGRHEETLREMILSGNSGGPEDYGTAIFNLHFQGNHLRDFMVESTYMRIEGRRCYRLVFSGFVALVFVASHSLPRSMRKWVLDPQTTVETYDAELSEFTFLRDTWNRVGESTRDVDIRLKP